MVKEIVELSTDIQVITAEINAYQRVAGEAIFEIGRRLKHVKEREMVHGEWSKWCESELGITRQHAHRFIKVYEELWGSNVTSGLHLGVKALYEIATLPPDQREQPHTVPSTGETKTVDEMTVRELREVKKALKEAESREQLLLNTIESIEAAPPEYIEVADTNTEAELRVYKERYGELVNEKDTVRRHDPEKRKAHYRAFAEDLDVLRRRYADILLEASDFIDYVATDRQVDTLIGEFERFIEGIAKMSVKESKIIDMEE